MNILNKLINPILNFQIHLTAPAKVYLLCLSLYIVLFVLCAVENENWHMRYTLNDDSVEILPVFESHQGNYWRSRQSFPVEFYFPEHILWFVFLLIVPVLFINFIFKMGGKALASFLVLACAVFLAAYYVRQGMRYQSVKKSGYRKKGGYRNAVEEDRKQRESENSEEEQG
jgi:hypothetical protein